MTGACVERDGVPVTGPHTLRLRPGDVSVLYARDQTTAAIDAKLCAGVVKATFGTVAICDFDPALQPAQAKRFVAFVPERPTALSLATFERYVELCAALWDVDARRARYIAQRHLTAIGEASPAALVLAAACIRPVRLIVLDQPDPVLLEYATALCADGPALVSTAVGRRAETPAGRAAKTASRVPA